MKNKLNSE